MLPLLSQRLVYIALLHPSMLPLYDATCSFLKFREPTLCSSIFPSACVACYLATCSIYFSLLLIILACPPPSCPYAASPLWLVYTHGSQQFPVLATSLVWCIYPSSTRHNTSWLCNCVEYYQHRFSLTFTYEVAGRLFRYYSSAN